MQVCEQVVDRRGGWDRCGLPAKWWFRYSKLEPWVSRCGRHALCPGNTKRSRVPITDKRPAEGRSE